MSTDAATFSRARLDAVLFDLDGVVTRTAHLHARAWKLAFDPVLTRAGQPPFDAEGEYRAHVDGKPRLDGARALLAARGLSLPEGTDDEPDTVRGVARTKHADFLALLATDGAQADAGALDLLRRLRAAGFKTAVVTASRSCPQVLASVGATDLFDVRVDGNDAADRGLRGKPAPDTFLAAAEALGVAPARAAVIEDAQAGVEAGRAGGFGLVVGVDRDHQAAALRARGAHVVVRDLGASVVEDDRLPPPALERLAELADRLRARPPAVFLDYDGTLSPIVDRPERAVLPPATREAVERLARRCPVAVVSGRDLVDVRDKVGVPGLWYAGSHGFDIAGPTGAHVHPDAGARLAALDAAEQELRAALAGVEGVLFERKRFSLAVHHRLVDDARVPEVEDAVVAARDRHDGLRIGRGKRVLELLPDLPWDKGAAVRWLLDVLGPERLPVYLGDDVTDEDAFRAIAADGVGVVVLDGPRPTAARYRVADPDEARALLEALAAALEAAP